MPNINHFKIKIDGTSAMIKNGKPYCRFDAKLFKRKKGKVITYTIEEVIAKLPDGAIACQEPDKKSGHFPHWVPVDENNPSHKYILEGFNNLEDKLDGTYEAIGPKIQDNHHTEEKHMWIPHFSEKLIFGLDMTGHENPFEFFKEFFVDFPFEGLVAYNEVNEPIGKIRRSDFGYKNTTGYNKASVLLQ